MSNIVGLDLSLTSTGVARVDDDGNAVLTRLQPRNRTGHPRLDYLSSAIRLHCSVATAANLVVIEGPSYGSKGGHEHERGGLWWLIAHMLWTDGIPYAVVAPAALKKYATGAGNAGKDAVLAAVIRRYPDVPVDGNDVADALVLAAMGADHLGRPLADMPQAHRAALAKVAWPELPASLQAAS